MLVLYYSPGASSLGPHIVLEEIGEPYETVLARVDIRSVEENITDPEYLKINPKGRVPALQVDGRILTEAPAILSFLGCRHPEARLMPANPEGAARCHEWMAWLSTTVHAVALGQIVRPQRFVADAKDFPAVSDKGRANLDAAFTHIEHELHGREWATGGAYTIVDPYLLFYYFVGGWLQLPMKTRYPAWTQVMERTMARPAVRRVLGKEGPLP
jgi:glutathione S-transferase